ncbi:MAG: DinB family protein [Saprospiraceae bacterium]
MTLIQLFLQELEREALTTRKMLSRVPDDKYDWRPHPKSMNIRSLATHIAELPTWITMTLTTDELDFAASPYRPAEINDTAALMAHFETSLADGRTQLVEENEPLLDKPWTLRNGDTVYSVSPKMDVIRMAFSQIIHHRAQLGVYLRLLDVPIPGSYGPSADDQSFS